MRIGRLTFVYIARLNVINKERYGYLIHVTLSPDCKSTLRILEDR